MTDVSTTVNAITVTDAGTAVTVDIGTWPAAHAATHGAAGYDPVTVAQSQVTGLTTDLALKAPLASPTFTGTPAAPTAAADTNTTQVATTAFVVAQAGTATPVVNGTGTVGTSLRFSRQDHIHPTDTSRAPTASPTFTGVVAVPAGSASAPSIVPDGDTNTGIYSPGADQLAIATAGTARVTIGATGGATFTGTITASSVDIVQNTTANNAFAQSNISRKDRAGAIVNSGDTVGQFLFQGYDGGAYRTLAALSAVVDGAPGSSDMPGRLVFFTTPDGSITGTERLRIDNAGTITGTGSLGAWTAYTPTLGGFTAGSGTPTAGVYCQIGKVVHFRAVWTYGTGSAAASARPTLTLPVTAKNATGAHVTASFFDTSAGAYYQAVPIQTSTTVVTIGVLGTAGVSDAASTTSPFTWATGDTITLTGTYEAA